MADISILIPVHNSEKFLSRCIRSLLDQSLPREHFEIIVIDDGSTDGSRKIIEAYESHITLITLDENVGLPIALNHGIKKSMSRFITRVDSDDYVNRYFLECLYSYFSYSPTHDAVSCDYLLVEDNEEIISRMDSLVHPIACGIMFQRDHLISLGLYNEDFKFLEDEEMRARFLKSYSIDRIPLPLYRYRRHGANMTNNTEKILEYRQKLNES